MDPKFPQTEVIIVVLEFICDQANQVIVVEMPETGKKLYLLYGGMHACGEGPI